MQGREQITFDSGAVLTALNPEEGASRPAVLAVPGGGYVACAPKEGIPIAAYFGSQGFAAFSLEYNTLFGSFDRAKWTKINEKARFPGPLLDLGRAVLAIRENAKAFGADPNRLAICGSSAGGHLTGCYLGAVPSGELDGLGAPRQSLWPNAIVLAYSVTVFAHLAARQGSYYPLLEAVFGTQEPKKEDLAARSPALLVDRHTPPTFLWHTAEDETVPVNNAMEMAAGLERAKVPFELHIFDRGAHAMGLSEGLSAAPWPALATAFLKRQL